MEKRADWWQHEEKDRARADVSVTAEFARPGRPKIDSILQVKRDESVTLFQKCPPLRSSRTIYANLFSIAVERERNYCFDYYAMPLDLL